MKISTDRDFRDNAGDMLLSKDPVLVTRQGHVVGVFFPCPEMSLPLDLKRDLFSVVSAALKREMEARGISEDEIAEDFAAWRKTRRTPNHEANFAPMVRSTCGSHTF